MRPLISYPPVSGVQLGYNLGGIDHAHVDQAVAGGASIVRTQFSWANVEDYTTGTLALTAPQSAFLSYCATKSVSAIVIAAYGPPYITIGTLTTTADTPSGTAAGVPIPVQSYGFTIDYPSCFVGDVNGATTQYTNKASYYGSLIASSTASSITLAAATRVDIPSGASISVQRLRYPPPSTDTDPSLDAYVRYATFLANQMSAAHANGWVAIWNEYVWPHDFWSELGAFYDTPPGAITITAKMKSILTKCQATTLPANVSFQNGVTDKTGFASLVNQGISIPRSITSESMHPYAVNPEGHNWDFLAWGLNNNRALPATLGVDSWWEVVNPLDQNSNFRNMAFLNNLTANSPSMMASECGLSSANDTNHARYLSRRVASLWGVGVTPVPYTLDDGSAVGSSTYSVAPSSVPRPSYFALQRMTGVVSRMSPGNDSSLVPTVASAPSSFWPLMTTTVVGARGHCTMFLWQMTNDNTNWESVASPTPVQVRLTVPNGLAVAESFDAVTGAPAPMSENTLYVADNVVAVRFTPSGTGGPQLEMPTPPTGADQPNVFWDDLQSLWPAGQVAKGSSLPSTDTPPSGTWLTPPGTVTVVTLLNNAAFGCFLFVPDTVTIQKIGTNVTVAGDATVAVFLSLYQKVPRANLYNQVIAEQQIAVGTGTGVQQASVSLTLPAGKYLAFLRHTFSVQPTFSARLGPPPLGGWAADITEATTDTSRGGVHGPSCVAGYSGTGPVATSISLQAGTRSLAPLVFLQVA